MAILLADIGGTNARFCLYEKGRLSSVCGYSCDDFKSAYSAIDEVLKNCPKTLNGMVIAGAGPVKNGILKWTNRVGWKVSVRELKKRYALNNILITNDVQAQGEGLKTLYKCVHTSILLTAGTGLGSCFLVADQVIPGEVGQIQTNEGYKIEDTISGSGIVRLYHLLGGDKRVNSAKKIEKMRIQKDKIAEKAFIIFYQEWGKIAARMVTGLYAIGGVYLWGGLIPKRTFDKKVFVASYRSTLPEMLQSIPVRLVNEKKLTFKGLIVLLRREFGESLR